MGSAATRRIRELPPPAGAVPVIGISGTTETGAEMAARRAGMTGFLHKPVSPQALAAALAEVAPSSAGAQGLIQ